ncbi:MAG: molecular chaperone DnaJ [Muribaculaceae bacterium]|nr:molecular chaperone DnaJ [Muribaculaceae bacterium]
MAQKRDYYEVLGVSKTATADELKKAYRKLAIMYHPDRQQGKSEAEKKEAEEKFKEAAEAYNVLNDPDKRARYDQYGFAGDQMGGGFGTGMSMDDFLRQFTGMFGGGFGGGFGGFSSFFGGDDDMAQQMAHGSDLRVRVELTLADVKEGVSKKLKLPRMVSCASCRGTGAKNGTALETCSNCHGRGQETVVRQTIMGRMQMTNVCHVCHGTGKIVKERCPDCAGKGLVRKDDVVTVNIPAGVAEGMTLQMRGKGNEAPGGGTPGDLLIVIEEKKHPQLERDGNDLIYNLMLDIPTAVLGGTVEVPTIEGKARVKISPATQPGTVLRLRGRGLPSPNHYGTGDLLVNVMVYVPERLTSEERAAIEKLQGSSNMKPSESTCQRLFARLRNMFH